DKHRIDPRHVIHVGNGTNDIPVFENVGSSIAVNALHPSVTAAARHAIPKLTDARLVVPLATRP
ncbi:MAG TPA: HAD hydrolase family protein, partial [Candidatus Thermoplasmatota archaeon]|nr:HAD hydrolase family protein [Candidatus Thermoplasmatota archaeon]